MNEHELANVDFGTYTEEQYFDDIGRLTEYRCDPDLTEILIRGSFDAGAVDAREGRAVPARPRPPGVPASTASSSSGAGSPATSGAAARSWCKALHARAERDGIAVLYETPAIALLHGDRGVEGVRVRHRGRIRRSARKGGGAGLRRVRGQCRDAGALSRAELGSRQGARHALQHRPGPRRWRSISALRPAGPLVGRACGALGSERAAVRRPRCRRPLPEAQLSVRHHRQRARRALIWTRASISTAIPMPNTAARIMNQPGMFAWQIFDQKIVHLLREEYRIPRITKEKADTLGGAGAASRRRRSRRLSGDACAPSTPRRGPTCRSTPTSMTGCAPAGLAIDKTNWAQQLDTPPYEAYAVTTGVTFTFGGLKITNDGAGRGHRRRTRSPASSPPARSSAASTTTTTPAAPG